MMHIKTYIFNHFYYQYLVLFTMVPRSNNIWSISLWSPVNSVQTRVDEGNNL